MTETRQKLHDDGDSDSEVEEEEDITKVEVDATKLTPLSPEVISKQVRRKAFIAKLHN
jgi:translation initiation factor 2 subunit 3